jgi:hypothetical protein
MQIVLFILLSLVSFSNAVDLKKCDKCSISKEYIKCTVYVEQKGDISKQNSCMIFAQSLDEGNSDARASWYYLLGGDFDNVIKTGKNAVKTKEYYAAEQVGEAYLLKGDKKNAKKYFELLKQKAPKSDIFFKKHIEVLSRLYPKKFDSSFAKEFL